MIFEIVATVISIFVGVVIATRPTTIKKTDPGIYFCRNLRKAGCSNEAIKEQCDNAGFGYYD